MFEIISVIFRASLQVYKMEMKIVLGVHAFYNLYTDSYCHVKSQTRIPSSKIFPINKLAAYRLTFSDNFLLVEVSFPQRAHISILCASGSKTIAHG